MVNKLNTFILLMWKHWTLAKRSPSLILAELLLPVLMALLFLKVLRFKVEHEQAQNFKPFSADFNNILCSNTSTSIAVAPKSKIVDQVVDRISRDCPKINFTQYKNSQQLNKAIFLNNFSAAIQFDDSLKNTNKNNIDLPSDLKVIIRIKSDDGNKKLEWFTQLLYPLIINPGPRNTIATGGEPEYQNRGFLLLQQLITLAVINNKSAEPRIMMCKYPYPPSVHDKSYNEYISFLLPFGIEIIFGIFYGQLVTYITTEKEQQLKESMKAMGLPLWLDWLAWFVRGFIILFILSSVTVLLLKINFIAKPFFPKTDSTLLFIFFILYACNVVSATFLTSVFFSNANVASMVGGFAFYICGFPYIVIVRNYFTTALEVKLGVSVLANSAMGFGILLIIRFESFEEGAQWRNLWDRVTPDDNLTLGYIMLMLIFDTFLYLIIALYVDAISPGKFGVPKPWYFPILFLRSCWRRFRLNNKVSETAFSNEGEFFEKFTGDLPKGIQMKKLSKSFGRKNVVKNLNLDIYEGHITVLLGHNGAGKTTTMSMISGMCPPTSGTVIVNGYDLRTNIDRVRDSMGLCFQHNVLFETLTVEEHLYFFSKLKGLEGQQLNAEINDYLNSVGLKTKKDEQIKKLSGGMKRKLSVAVAFCGKPKVVLLDEPTSGIDPSARDMVHHLIQREKRGRTILLTTHSMDEADLLGDRIAIMAAGELQCCGSSFFLKKKFAAGYFLIMEVSRNCNPQSVTSLLKMYIPQVKLYSHVGSELTYQLPDSESSKFERTLQQLESNSSQLGILNYGISYATLDQVFMKVGVDEKDKTSEQRQDSLENRSRINYFAGCILMANQFFAMLLKKLLSTFRNWIFFIFQIILIVCMLLYFLISIQQHGRQNNYLKITLDSYPNSVTLVSGDETHPLFVSYKSVLSGHGKLWEVIDISETILTKIKSNPRVVKSSYIVGASFNKNVITVWFNGDPYHSAPLALGLVLNSLYKYHLGKDKSISFVNHPLPLDLKLQLDEFNYRAFMLIIALGYSIPIIACFYIVFYIKERVCKSRHLQYASGTNVFIFWIAALLTDLFIYMLLLIPVIITIAVLKIQGFTTFEEIGRLTLVFITFGFSVLPFLYLVSSWFSNVVNGFSIMFTIAILFGLFGVAIVYVLRVMQVSDIASRTLNWILLFISPFYTFCKSVLDLYLIYTTTAMCSENASPEQSCKILNITACCDIKDYFSMTPPGIGLNVLISFIMFLVLLATQIAKELRYFTLILRKCHKEKPPKPVTNLDDDVEEEIKKIKITPERVLNKENCLVLNDVTKYYKKDPVVNGLCLAVKPFECFGLLGVNGAGKTTTFKMLTGDIEFSYGNAWLKGLNIKTQPKNSQKLIGYCPQFDALLEELTVRDILKIFALIRGIPHEKCKKFGEELAQEFDFSKHIDKRIKHLSGGTKRKVSCAVAVIGEPPVVFLDEPTTGIDPASKRLVWKYFCKFRDRGKCIILTSHSMEECEALCTRIAIMVNGNFQCLGSVQHLKNKFAQGYFLTVIVKKVENVSLHERVSAIASFVKQNFPNAKMEEKYEELLTFQLPKSTMPWSQIFGLFERHKKKLNIEDYSIGQCSLNQVFLSFAKQQQQDYDNIQP